MEEKPGKRRTGFTRPLHFHQIMSWVGYLLQLIFFFLIEFPSLTLTERYYVLPSFIAIYMIYNISFLSATTEEHVDARLPDSTNESYTNCRWCEFKVNMDTKHCRSCNICRVGFDHHCFFLNNCVTVSNYNRFFVGILFLFISTVYSTFLNIFAIMATEYDQNASIILINELYGISFAKWVFYALNGLSLLLNLGIQVFMVYLLGLHSVLIQRNITTFDIIQHWRYVAANKDASALKLKTLDKSSLPLDFSKIHIPPLKPVIDEEKKNIEEPQDITTQKPDTDVSSEYESHVSDSEPKPENPNQDK